MGSVDARVTLLVYMLLMICVVESMTSTKGKSVPYNCMGSQMAHTGNNVMISCDRIAHN